MADSISAGVDDLFGLTDAEVAEAVAAGNVNTNTDVKTKTVGQILAEHTFTLFNGVNVALALLVVTTGQYRNMLFMGVVIINLVIGVVQELRAKRMVDALSILAAKDVRVRRSGKECLIPVEEVVLGDIVLLAHGDQVPADGIVVFGDPLVDESLLTGESVNIEKHVGSELYSGSFVVSGAVAYRVTKVGLDGLAAKINAEARYVKPVSSEILRTLRMIIQLATIIIVPLGVGLYLRTVFMEGVEPTDALLSAVAAVVGMIPQGLVLLTSGVLAIATTRLGRRGVLIQQSYCVETLARVDTLCLDKTGTITSGSMSVTGVFPVEGAAEDDVVRAFAIIGNATSADANETSRALLAYADGASISVDPHIRAIPFSSARKYSGAVTADGTAYVMGAAQFVLGPHADERVMSPTDLAPMDRVLTVAICDGFDDHDCIVGNVEPIGLVSIADEIRPSASATIDFFRQQGVELKVISGDDPRTVSAIAAHVGIDGADRYVDASTLSDEQLCSLATTTSVFGRVTPQQKRTLVKALHAADHVVAMTGDGVNDVLALKEADCSIAMASGSAAARNVAEVVLTDNDFSHMPEVVAEGRRSINNLQRSASLFLVKTVFSAVLSAVCIALPPYPFSPIRMTLLSSAIIGWPSFVLALEPNHDRVQGNFLANVLSRSLPGSVAIVFALLLAQVGERLFGFGPDVMAVLGTLSMYLTGAIGLALIIRISLPMNLLRSSLVVSVILIFLTGCLCFPSFFGLAPFTPAMLVFLVVVGVISLILFNRLYDLFNGPGDGQRRLYGLVKRLEVLYDRTHGIRPGSKRGSEAR